MNHSAKVLALCVFAASVLGCTSVTSYTGEPSGEAPSDVPWFYNGWISKNQDEIVQKAQSFIREKHPNVDSRFPNIQINSVEVNGGRDNQQEIKQVLQSLSDRMLGNRPGAPTWTANVIVSFHHHEPSGATIAAIAGPEVVVCFSTIFVICPARYKEEVQMEVHITTPTNKKIDFVTAGYGELYESTAMMEDNDKEFANNAIRQNTAGLVAAIVGAADKLVDAYDKVENLATQAADH